MTFLIPFCEEGVPPEGMEGLVEKSKWALQQVVDISAEDLLETGF